jgi:hypothetical protein
MKSFTFRLPPSTRSKLRRLARAGRKTESQLMRELIDEGMELQEIRQRFERRFGSAPPNWKNFDPLQKVLYGRNITW